MRLSGDWESWLGFFVDAVASTANQAVHIAQQLNTLLHTDKARLQQLGRLAGSAAQILDALFRNPVINIATLKQITGITPATIGKALDAMEQQLGMVREVTGQKRNRIFTYTAYINILNQELT